MYGKGKKKKANPEAENELTEKDVQDLLKNCKIYKVKDAPRNPWRIDSLPTARLIDKYTRDNNYAVTNSYLNASDKSATIEYVVNVDKIDKVKIVYENLCAHFGWLGFELSENQQTIYPKW